MIKPESRPARNEQLLTQQSAGTLILFNLEDGQYYALNEVGTRIWELSDGTRSIAEMVTIVSQEFDAPSEMVEADVMQLLEELAHEGMVSEDEGVV